MSWGGQPWFPSDLIKIQEKYAAYYLTRGVNSWSGGQAGNKIERLCSKTGNNALVGSGRNFLDTDFRLDFV